MLGGDAIPIPLSPDEPLGAAIWFALNNFIDEVAEARDRLSWIESGDLATAWKAEPDHPWRILSQEKQVELLKQRIEFYDGLVEQLRTLFV